MKAERSANALELTKQKEVREKLLTDAAELDPQKIFEKAVMQTVLKKDGLQLGKNNELTINFAKLHIDDNVISEESIVPTEKERRFSKAEIQQRKQYLGNNYPKNGLSPQVAGGYNAAKAGKGKGSKNKGQKGAKGGNKNKGLGKGKEKKGGKGGGKPN